MSIDTIAPTPERARRGHIVKPELDRTRNVTAYRDQSIPERMGLARELLNAFDDFEADWLRSNRQPPCIGGYGERMPGDDPHSKAARIADGRIEGDRAVARALADVGDPVTAAVLVALCGGTTAELIGKHVLGRSNAPQARAAAHERIAMGCHRLAIHYGYISRPRGDP